jgi:predicted permease
MNQLWQDLRFGFRLWAKTPWVTFIAILSLAIGIGINSTAFSVVDALFLRPPPGKNPSQLVSIIPETPQGPDMSSYPEYLDLNQDTTAFSGVLARAGHMVFLTTARGTELLPMETVSNNFFSVLAVNVAAGRSFTPAPSRSSSSPHFEAIISYSLWRSHFGGDPSIIGKPINLNHAMFTVVGVAPEGFQGLGRVLANDVWLPASLEGFDSAPQNRQFREFDELVGRLAPGVTPAQARAQLAVLAARLAKAYPATNTNRTFALVSESERFSDALRPTGLIIAIVSLVLLVCCANVASLLIARSETRAREIAMRRALGARRWRLIRQLLTEGLLLALAGGAVGLLLARWLIDLQPALMPSFFTSIGLNLHIDQPVLTFTFASVLGTVLLFGLVPALVASKGNLIAAMKNASSGRPGRKWFARHVFTIGEIALSFVLLVAASLFARSYSFSASIHPGFDTRKNFLLVDLVPSMAGYNGPQTFSYFQDLKPKLAATPGVQSVSIARRFLLTPTGGGAEVKISIPGSQSAREQEDIRVKFNAVDSDYFQTVGTRILLGRQFSASEIQADSPVAVISHEMSRRFWPGVDAIGKHIVIDSQDFQIIGVAQDAKINSVHEAIEPYIYLPFAERRMGDTVLIVETKTNPLRLAPAIEKQIHDMNPNVPITDVQTNRTLMRNVLWADRTEAEVVGVLSLLGALLSAIGLYGVISQLVNHRRQELGVRIALGAQRTDIVRLVLVEAAKLTALGGIIGLIAALATTRFLSDLLFGVRPYDAIAFAAACAFVALIVPAASLYPAYRATKLHPMDVLQFE